jgi:hypothetical protein
VTLLAISCAYVGWQAKIVRERKTMLENPRFTLCSEVETVDGERRLPWVRRLLGDLDCGEIYAVDDVTEEELAEYRRVFPEATVRRQREEPDGPVRWVFPDQESKNH